MESTANCFVGHFEFVPRLCPAGVDFGQGLLHEMQRHGGGISLEISPRPVSLDSIAPFGYLPLELDFRKRGSLREIDLHALSSRFDVSAIHQPGECRCPKTRNGAATSIERQVIARALVIPAGRHDPGVFPVEITLLWPWNGGLIPGMALIHRIAQRI